MRTAKTRLNVLDELEELYPFARGLDYLVRTSDSHDSLREQILADWWRTLDASIDRPFEVLDYGTGFGDLLWAIVAEAQHRGTVRPMALAVHDTDARLAAYAVRRFENLPRTSVRNRLSEEEGGQFDAVLASHVLYYVADRPGLVQHLAGYTKPGGITTFVLRSTRCDTYAIRSLLIEATADHDRPPRIEADLVLEVLSDCGIVPAVSSVTSTLRIPVDEVSFDHLVRGHPSSDATEAVRFVAHLSTKRPPHPAAVPALRSALRQRQVGAHYQLALVDDVISGAKPPCTTRTARRLSMFSI
ncbi:MAG: class I SAM-dependent methyltransferase [Actinomycetota bacterium]|nr:class I SAM-dependent methyltransferase [Actinomycetota bacterium]